MIQRIFPFLLCIALAGCGSQSPPSIRLVLDGPPLHIAMRSESAVWAGQMDRGCMAGFGSITVREENGTVCQGNMDHPANDKGRLYADLSCANGSSMTLIIRNLGPDQGMGLGRISRDAVAGEQTTLFYHPSYDEAKRRLEQIRAEIATARESRESKTN